MENPYEKYQSVLLSDYSTAQKLAKMTLSLYNGYRFKCDLSDVSGMDEHHFAILVEMMAWYRENGEC
jgi:ABC-type transporter Mla MlaB component